MYIRIVCSNGSMFDYGVDEQFNLQGMTTLIRAQGGFFNDDTSIFLDFIVAIMKVPGDMPHTGTAMRFDPQEPTGFKQ